MSKKNQQGSSHLILIIALVIVILGLLGFVFYQNFIQQSQQSVGSNKTSENNSEQTSTIIPSEIALSEVVSDRIYNTGLSIKYPADWTIVTEDIGNLETGASQNTITSPDNNVEISFSVGNGGMGGYCIPEESGIISAIDVDVMPNYPNTRFASVSTTLDNDDNSHHYYVGIQTNNDSIVNAKVGDTDCFYAFAGVPQISSLSSGHLQLSATFKNVNNDTSSTLNAIDQIKTTDNYKIAKQIIQSLYIK